MNVEMKLQAVFAEIFEIDPNTVLPETKLNEINGWDSLGQLRIIMAIEDAFDVVFTIEEVASLTQYSSISEKLQSKLQK